MLRPEIREGKFHRDEVAVSFGRILRGEAPPPYDSPERFFEATHLTDTLRVILNNVLERVSGRGGNSVVVLKSGFGGGKTHILAAVYYAITHPEAAGRLMKGYESVKAFALGVDASEINHFRKPLWGVLGEYLGVSFGGEVPETKELAEAIKRRAPFVFLVDEVGEYFRSIRSAMGRGDKDDAADEVILFFRRLTDALGDRDVLIVSVPDESAPYDEWVQQHLRRLVNELRRRGVEYVPISQLSDVYSIVKKRLFVEVDDQVASRVADKYSRYYRKYREWFVEEWTRAEELKSAYPFHPAFIRTLWERTSSIPDFQRTRDLIYVLSLAAYYVLARRENIEYLILPGDLDLTIEDFKKFFTDGVGRPQYRAIIEHDLDLARRLGEYYYHAAAGLYIYSLFGGDIRRHAADLKTAVTLAAKPDKDPSIYEEKLRELLERLWYLSEEGGRYWFSAEPNVVRVLDEQKNRVSAEDAYEVMEKEVDNILKAMRGTGLPLDEEVLSKLEDIEDESRFRIYIQHPRLSLNVEELKRRIDALIYRNSVLVLLHGDMPIEKAKYVKACEQLRDELTEESQRARLGDLCSRRRSEFCQSFYKAYSQLLVPMHYGIDVLQLEFDTAGDEGCKSGLGKRVVDAIVRKLVDVGKIIPASGKRSSVVSDVLYNTYLLR
jgi:hypothetical protein